MLVAIMQRYEANLARDCDAIATRKTERPEERDTKRKETVTKNLPSYLTS
jgi:hypothetical protein